MLPDDPPSLLLQAAGGTVVVVRSRGVSVAATRVEAICFQVERGVLVGFHLVSRPRAAKEKGSLQKAVAAIESIRHTSLGHAETGLLFSTFLSE